MHFLALRGINRTALGTKLLLTVVFSSLVDYISSFQILKAQHCSLSLNDCFTPPSAPHPAPTPTPPPLARHLPPIDSIQDITGAFGSPPGPNTHSTVLSPAHLPPIDSIHDITGAEKTIRKTSSIQVASRISYEMIAI